jgi:hypothetical protein
MRQAAERMHLPSPRWFFGIGDTENVGLGATALGSAAPLPMGGWVDNVRCANFTGYKTARVPRACPPREISCKPFRMVKKSLEGESIGCLVGKDPCQRCIAIRPMGAKGKTRSITFVGCKHVTIHAKGKMNYSWCKKSILKCPQ